MEQTLPTRTTKFEGNCYGCTARFEIRTVTSPTSPTRLLPSVLIHINQPVMNIDQAVRCFRGL